METNKILELIKKAEDKVNSTMLSNIRKTEINLILLEIQKEAINYSQCCKSDSELLNVLETNPNFEEWLQTHEKFKDNTYVWGMGYVMSYADMKAKHKELIELNI